jgi:hypothetical protein
MRKSEKVRHQLKSRWYYIFWGAATLSVFAGQLYVGTGYRKMADTNKDAAAGIGLLIEVLTYVPKGRYQPLIPPPRSQFNESDMVVR